MVVGHKRWRWRVSVVCLGCFGHIEIHQGQVAFLGNTCQLEVGLEDVVPTVSGVSLVIGKVGGGLCLEHCRVRLHRSGSRTGLCTHEIK